MTLDSILKTHVKKIHFLKQRTNTQVGPGREKEEVGALTGGPEVFENSKKQKVIPVSVSTIVGQQKFHSLRLRLASPNTIKKWAERILPSGEVVGEVKNAQTVNYKTLKPEKGGLFCERIFGPVKDFYCACGKQNTEPNQKVCPVCGVAFVSSQIRRYKMGYIALVSPVTHVWYLKNAPSSIALLLNLNKKKLEAITYCSESFSSNTTSLFKPSELQLQNVWPLLKETQFTCPVAPTQLHWSVKLRRSTPDLKPGIEGPQKEGLGGQTSSPTIGDHQRWLSPEDKKKLRLFIPGVKKTDGSSPATSLPPLHPKGGGQLFRVGWVARHFSVGWGLSSLDSGGWRAGKGRAVGAKKVNLQTRVAKTSLLAVPRETKWSFEANQACKAKNRRFFKFGFERKFFSFGYLFQVIDKERQSNMRPHFQSKSFFSSTSHYRAVSNVFLKFKKTHPYLFCRFIPRLSIKEFKSIWQTQRCQYFTPCNGRRFYLSNRLQKVGSSTFFNQVNLTQKIFLDGKLKWKSFLAEIITAYHFVDCKGPDKRRSMDQEKRFCKLAHSRLLPPVNKRQVTPLVNLSSGVRSEPKLAPEKGSVGNPTFMASYSAQGNQGPLVGVQTSRKNLGAGETKCKSRINSPILASREKQGLVFRMGGPLTKPMWNQQISAIYKATPHVFSHQLEKNLLANPLGWSSRWRSFQNTRLVPTFLKSFFIYQIKKLKKKTCLSKTKPTRLDRRHHSKALLKQVIQNLQTRFLPNVQAVNSQLYGETAKTIRGFWLDFTDIEPACIQLNNSESVLTLYEKTPVYCFAAISIDNYLRGTLSKSYDRVPSRVRSLVQVLKPQRSRLLRKQVMLFENIVQPDRGTLYKTVKNLYNHEAASTLQKKVIQSELFFEKKKLTKGRLVLPKAAKTSLGLSDTKFPFSNGVLANLYNSLNGRSFSGNRQPFNTTNDVISVPTLFLSPLRKSLFFHKSIITPLYNTTPALSSKSDVFSDFDAHAVELFDHETWLENFVKCMLLRKERGILINNYYTLSQTFQWPIQRDWKLFLNYMAPNIDKKDCFIPEYLERGFSFDLVVTGAGALKNFLRLFTNPPSPTLLSSSLSVIQGVGEQSNARSLFSNSHITQPLQPTLEKFHQMEFYKANSKATLNDKIVPDQYPINRLELTMSPIELLMTQIDGTVLALNQDIKKIEDFFKYQSLFIEKMEERVEKMFMKLVILRSLRVKSLRRLKMLRPFKNSRVLPEWMILDVLPVLPPALRPVIQLDSQQVGVSDLNKLYQTVLFRNKRVKRFYNDAYSLNFSEEMRYAQRLLQESVDALIENGKGGSMVSTTANNRPLKSLSDMLKGKKGRFRQNLLGKRVDYSGRSVIVVGPQLKLHECGLPKEMAIELFQPFLIQRLIFKKITRNFVSAKKLLQLKPENPQILESLLEVMENRPVLLNRAPTLHRLGIQAFQPKLVSGRAILLHPLVCTAFNADFDGDQMAVHIPLSFQATAEAWKLMGSRNNLLSPATGEPILVPSQDMVLGCYYLTTLDRVKKRIDSKGMFLTTRPAITVFSLRDKWVDHLSNIVFEQQGYVEKSGPNVFAPSANTYKSNFPLPIESVNLIPMARGKVYMTDLRYFLFTFISNSPTSYQSMDLVSEKSGAITHSKTVFKNTILVNSKDPRPAIVLANQATLDFEANVAKFVFGAKNKEFNRLVLYFHSELNWFLTPRNKLKGVKTLYNQIPQHNIYYPVLNKNYYSSWDQVLQSLNQELIDLHTCVWLRWPFYFEGPVKRETCLEVRLDKFGNSVVILRTYQKHVYRHAFDGVYTSGQPVIYIRTTAGRVLMNKNIDGIFTSNPDK